MEWIAYWLITALIVASVAKAKGRSFFGWLILGFLTNILGIIWIAIMPAKRPNAAA